MIDFINFAKPATGNFLVDIIYWLVQISTSVTLGVVLFTVLLKLITLPFDFFSRASMRKNSLRMEQMRPELEKLQKQYADNKQLYNQKMMALYKKNGYSMFGSCLPSILTLVIFIVAINAFTNYSKFQNQQYFYNMSLSYDSVIYTGMEIDDTYITRDEDGKLVIDYAQIKGEIETAISGNIDLDDTAYEHDIIASIESKTTEQGGQTVTTNWLTVTTTNGYVYYEKLINSDGSFGATENFYLINDQVKKASIKNEENNFLKIKRVVDGENKELAFSDAYAYYCAEIDAYNAKPENETKLVKATEDEYVEIFITDIRQEKSAERFRAENEQFLWVKNIWVTDSPMAHPVESSWDTFKGTHGYSSDKELGADKYNLLIAKLDFEKSAPNGFFILVVLTAGISFLMQIVMGKSQKAQMELQTVDGQGAQTQKIMKWMMPILMAVFSFMYTAAFSIYIILSNILSIGTTYGINFIVDRRFRKKQGANGDKNVIRGRVYTPKEEPKQEKKKEKKSKTEPPKADFLSGTADKKKHVRGRLK
ncbi:MAG: YidC/Oxa1 family membrane protein insertase [Clostridia bacterium]|nr:YidC/Oxa1 family membrane protein insertase [Clostridia bacterium]